MAEEKTKTASKDLQSNDSKKKEVKQTSDDAKIAELKIELLKSGAKRQRIKREIARILTLQNSKMKTGEHK